MVCIWRVFIASLILVVCGLGILKAECEPTTRQPLALIAHVEGDTIDIGTELTPMVSLVNISDKPLELEYMKPSIVVPEIWNATSNQRVLNAPTYVYDQICARQKTILAPKEELSLYSMPILIAKQSPPFVRSDHLQAFWATLPGDFALRYSVPLRNFLPGASGQLQAKDVLITLIDPSKELSGLLCFEQGRGYYLSMGTKGGKGEIWLQVAENKILVRKLSGLVGSQVKVSGCLRRMRANTQAAIPAGALYFSKFEIYR